MANQIPGISRRVQPNVFTRIKTKQRVNAVNGGIRDVVIIGEGEREEVVVEAAIGGGADGVNANYAGVDSPDGRHFTLQSQALIPGRTSIFKNSLPLTVLEEAIDSDPFDARYDVRLEPTTGRIQLQSARLVDVGGNTGITQYFTPGSANVGNGYPLVNSSSLVDSNAPAESWTARVTSVIYDALGDPVPGEATISLSGSVSGIILDTDGNPIFWKSDGNFVSNGILNIAFPEGPVAFNVGDRFTIRVASGVLQAGNRLEAKYIATLDLNDPEIFDSPSNLFAKHGDPSVANSLSLAAQMAFENGAPRVVALQAKPPVPRKTSQTLIAADDPLSLATEGATGSDDVEDTIFPLDLGKSPSVDGKVNVFVVSSDGSEEQLALNKYAFYDAGFTSKGTAYSGFVTDGAIVNSYTVFSSPEDEQTGDDGYVAVVNGTSGLIYFESATVAFASDRSDVGESDIGKKLEILSPDALAGTSPATHTYTIVSIGDGYGNMNICTAVSDISGPTLTDGYSYTGVKWAIQDPADESVFFAISDDVASVQLTAGKGLRIEYVDSKDADFFDQNWNAAFEQLETIEVQYVVPVPSATYSNIFATGKVHVEKMSQIVNAKERILLIGSFPGLTPNNLIGRDLAAVENIGILEGIQGDDPEEVLAGNIEDLANYDVGAAFGDSFRVVWMHPDEIVRNIAGTNTVLPGFYMAASLGGFLAGQAAVQEPPTFKTLTGFNILRSKVYRTITLDELADAGVLVVQPVTGGGKMLHGLTTVQSEAPEEEEISIVGIRDTVARILRNSLRPFVGKVNSPTLVAEISGGLDKVLRGLISLGLLTDYGAITVQRNPLEPRQIDISVEVAPTGPINWIFIDVTVAL